MDEDDSQSRGGRRGRDDFKSRLLTRLLAPIAAAGASAATGYAVKKAPELLERMMPQLRALAGDAEGITRDLPAKAASVASSAGDVAQDLGDRAKSLVSSGSPTSNGSSRRKKSPAELEKRWEERAQRRAERAKARAR